MSGGVDPDELMLVKKCLQGERVFIFCPPLSWIAKMQGRLLLLLEMNSDEHNAEREAFMPLP
jgi:hypothetical protein